ncbi:hypothetical protein D3C81_851560 [compost metagenome]
MHPPGVQQLAHGRVDDRKAGAPLFPGREVFRRIAPGQGFGLGAEGAVPGNLWITRQDVLVELPPEQLVDPGLDAGAAAVELATVAGQGAVQALPGRDHASSQVSGKLAGAGLGREVTQVLVVVYCFIEKARQTALCLGFASRPVVAQGARGCVEAVHVFGYWVACDRHRRLGLYPSG